MSASHTMLSAKDVINVVEKSILNV